MNLYYISLVISLSGTDLCHSTFSKNTQFENTFTYFSNTSENLQESQSSKVTFWKDRDCFEVSDSLTLVVIKIIFFIKYYISALKLGFGYQKMNPTPKMKRQTW